MKVGTWSRLAWLSLAGLLAIASATVWGQTTPGTLRGQVTDPTGAVVPQASVSVAPESGPPVTATVDKQGNYEIRSLAPGNYTVTATAKDLTSEAQGVTIESGKIRQLNIPLAIAVQKEVIQVQEEAPTVSVSPSEDTAGTLVLKGKDLEALSDDPDELQTELEALAGPSAGPNGGQIYIDGFTGGQLPPKSSIREIRINQNPFSAEYDKLGYGRIEIFTKPGTDQYHGQVFFNDNNAVLNTRNPFLGDAEQPGYNTTLINGNVGGPLSKKASFFINFEQRNINDLAIVNAQVLNPCVGVVPCTLNQAITNPSTRTNFSPRLDYQLTTTNTLVVRYQYLQSSQTNQGVGQFSLPSQGFNSSSNEQSIQITDTQVISPRTVNETRFQYIRDRGDQTAQNDSPVVAVPQAFLSGGNPIGTSSGHADHYELQNYTSMALGAHSIKFGGRVRVQRDAVDYDNNFNGTFLFNSLTCANPAEGCYSPIPSMPSQYSVVTGSPRASLTLFDASLYGQDEWRIRPNMTLNYGLRLEGQNHINNHLDVAPRISFAWGLGKGKATPKTVLRGGYGVFYDRFTDNLLLNSELLNGVTQQLFLVTGTEAESLYQSCLTAINALAPCTPSLSSANGAVPSSYQVAPNLHAPYTLQAAATVERQLAKTATLSVTYLNTRGDRQLYLRNLSALPTDVATSPTSPLSNVYQYESEGIFKENQLIANFRVTVAQKVSLFGYYALTYADSDLGTGSAASVNFSGFSSGLTPDNASFVSESYDPSLDYGRASFAVHDRLFLGGTFALPYAVRLSPFIIASSGRPFDIQLGQDVNGDSIFNDRPEYCPPNGTSCRQTPWGNFNTAAPTTPYNPIPINLGNGPANFTFNLRVSKSFGFGKKLDSNSTQGGPGGPGGPGGRGGGQRSIGMMGGPGMGLGNAVNQRYSLTVTANVRNLFNVVNLAPPNGNLMSPVFGESTSLAGGPFNSSSANRRIDLQLLFAF